MENSIKTILTVRPLFEITSAELNTPDPETTESLEQNDLYLQARASGETCVEEYKNQMGRELTYEEYKAIAENVAGQYI